MKPSHETSRSAVEQDPRWNAIVARDRAGNGTFWYAVVTTGVYCRPSCGARRPRPDNVRFFGAIADARRAGFRPCKRCKPDQSGIEDRYSAKVASACRTIEASESAIALADLAKAARLSPHHFHRIFKAVTGLTPRNYSAAHRARRARAELRTSATVTEAIYESGFNSNSRFYSEADHMLGMKPTEYRTGGAHTQIHFAVGECSLGSILVASTERGVCAIMLGDDPDALVRDLQDQFPNAAIVGADKSFEQTVAVVVGMVEAPERGIDLPLDVRGTAFQQRVWQALRHIPAGSTASYAEIASHIGSPRSVRAVAQACAANALAIAIPCHRVVKQDGSISGYRWGVDRKRALLKKEGNGSVVA